MLSVAEALKRVLSEAPEASSERVHLIEAIGRVTAAPVEARVTNPPCDVSAMDGYAVKAGTEREFRVVGRSSAGQGFAGQINLGEAVRIFTGAPLPDGADTVIIQENVMVHGDVITLSDGNALVTGKHVRKKGQDFAAGDHLIKTGVRLNARLIALAAAMNCDTIMCAHSPRVGILATGDELVFPGEKPGPSQIISSSPYGLVADINAWGGVATNLGIARDQADALTAKLAGAEAFDIVVTIGGASVGDYDLIQSALAEDLRLNFWKIAMRPGKPLIFGRYRGKLFIGLPGNPVSAFVCSQLFLKPLIFKILGETAHPHKFVRATLTASLKANDSRQEYSRCTLEYSADGTLLVTPMPVQDSGMLLNLAIADGLAIRPPNDPPLSPGQQITVLDLR